MDPPGVGDDESSDSEPADGPTDEPDDEHAHDEPDDEPRHDRHETSPPDDRRDHAASSDESPDAERHDGDSRDRERGAGWSGTSDHPENREWVGGESADDHRRGDEAAGDDGASGRGLDGDTPGANEGTGTGTAEGASVPGHRPRANERRSDESRVGDRTRREPPTAHREAPEESTVDEGDEWATFAYDVVSSVVAVVLVGFLLFAVSGVWPPMVAIESPSMTPHMQTGDLVFVMDEERFPGEGAQEGVVTAQVGADVDYRKFERPGDVIVYNPDGNPDQTPIIHRAMLWVEEGEDWYEKADRQSVGRYSECGDTPDEAMPNCPAPYDGFVTKGDANGVYDQVQGLSGPVKPAWVVGTAQVRVPKLGCIRLRTEGCLSLFTASVVTATPTDASAAAPEDDPRTSVADPEVAPGKREFGSAVTRQAV